MAAIPRISEADARRIEQRLADLLRQTDAKHAMVIDRAGFVVAHGSDADAAPADARTLGALAANTYAATAAIAGLIGEPDFSCVYQEGSCQSLVIQAVGDCALLVVIFDASVSGGAVKYYAGLAAGQLEAALAAALERAGGERLDLSSLNLSDIGDVFRRR